MKSEDIIRSWEESSPFAEPAVETPADPAGPLSLSDALLEEVSGATTEYNFTTGCCEGLTHVPSTCTCTWGPTCWPPSDTYARVCIS